MNLEQALIAFPRNQILTDGEDVLVVTPIQDGFSLRFTLVSRDEDNHRNASVSLGEERIRGYLSTWLERDYGIDLSKMLPPDDDDEEEEYDGR